MLVSAQRGLSETCDARKIDHFRAVSADDSDFVRAAAAQRRDLPLGSAAAGSVSTQAFRSFVADFAHPAAPARGKNQCPHSIDSKNFPEQRDVRRCERIPAFRMPHDADRPVVRVTDRLDHAVVGNSPDIKRRARFQSPVTVIAVDLDRPAIDADELTGHHMPFDALERDPEAVLDDLHTPRQTPRTRQALPLAEIQQRVLDLVPFGSIAAIGREVVAPPLNTIPWIAPLAQSSSEAAARLGIGTGSRSQAKKNLAQAWSRQSRRSPYRGSIATRCVMAIAFMR